MTSHFYCVGEVILSLISCEKESIGTYRDAHSALPPSTYPMYLCPSIDCDGEIVIDTQESTLLSEALCVAAYHLSAYRGLPLYEYTFLCDGIRYTVTVDKENKIEINLGECKQLYTNIDISYGMYSLFANVYTGAFRCVLMGTDRLSGIDATALTALLRRDKRTRATPICLYEREGESPVLRVLCECGKDSPPTLAYYAAYLNATRGKEGSLSLPFATVSFLRGGLRMKVLPKRVNAP